MSAGRARAEIERARANLINLQSQQYERECDNNTDNSTRRSSAFRLDVATLEHELTLRISQLLQTEFSSFLNSHLSKNHMFAPLVPLQHAPQPQLICTAISAQDDAAAVAASHILSSRLLNSANVSNFSPRSNSSAPQSQSRRQLRPIALDDAAEQVMNVALKRLPRHFLILDDAPQPNSAPATTPALPLLSSPPRIVISAPTSMPDVIIHELDGGVALCAAAFRRRCASSAAAGPQKQHVLSRAPQLEQLRAHERATPSIGRVEKVHRPRICIVVLDEAARAASESFAARLHV